MGDALVAVILSVVICFVVLLGLDLVERGQESHWRRKWMQEKRRKGK
jgi:hypothetical protein